MIVNQLLLRRTAVLSSSSRRAFSTTASAFNSTPQFKREGPTAHKGDKHKFDDGRDDPHYPGVQQKNKAMNDPYPNRPNADRQDPEPESPKGHEGAFADHRGRGSRADGEHLTGSEEAAETRTADRVGQLAKNAAKSVFGSSDKRSFSTSSRNLAEEPTQVNRNTPATTPKGSLNEHPGYTTGDAPIDSQDPSEMPKPSEHAMPSSASGNASTKAAAPHPDVNAMADGANQPGGGVDAIHPEDRTQNSWGANARSAQFNPEEGKRQPLQHGGSHEGGFKGQPGGKSRT
ncbi:transketolase [Pseudozyma hubeiensis SY62]|uniref:Transketolase n=1 Tax=Pseudozyma hubeiensis (strain SY62) TaxID=1305764 RepID=R9P7S2_PSEHS|nr:transketolase [Pseudozyma hubeiensis SY62]GAC97369.1 transketolase [Pseudozyma hubeiensis SY62]